jgi:hypothetical protein
MHRPVDCGFVELISTINSILKDAISMTRDRRYYFSDVSVKQSDVIQHNVVEGSVEWLVHVVFEMNIALIDGSRNIRRQLWLSPRSLRVDDCRDRTPFCTWSDLVRVSSLIIPELNAPITEDADGVCVALSSLDTVLEDNTGSDPIEAPQYVQERLLTLRIENYERRLVQLRKRRIVSQTAWMVIQTSPC